MLYGGGAPSGQLIVRSAARRGPIAACWFGVASKRLGNEHSRSRKARRATWAGGRTNGGCVHVGEADEIDVLPRRQAEQATAPVWGAQLHVAKAAAGQGG